MRDDFIKKMLEDTNKHGMTWFNKACWVVTIGGLLLLFIQTIRYFGQEFYYVTDTTSYKANT